MNKRRKYVVHMEVEVLGDETPEATRQALDTFFDDAIGHWDVRSEGITADVIREISPGENDEE